MNAYYKEVPNAGTKDCVGVTTNNFIEWLKLPAEMAKRQAATLEMILKAVISYAEGCTRREITFKTFELLLDCLHTCPIEIRRAPLNEVVSITYLDTNNDEQTVDPSTYYVVESASYSTIVLEPEASWPTDISQRRQSVKITFTAGYGDEDSCKLPDDLTLAILTHAAKVYENRGDCDCSSSNDIAKWVPAQAKAIYGQYKIIWLAI